MSDLYRLGFTVKRKSQSPYTVRLSDDNVFSAIYHGMGGPNDIWFIVGDPVGLESVERDFFLYFCNSEDMPLALTALKEPYGDEDDPWEVVPDSSYIDRLSFETEKERDAAMAAIYFRARVDGRATCRKSAHDNMDAILRRLLLDA